MKLTKDILPEYFTIASAHNSHYKQNTNTFDFVDRESDTLVITAGDSWTWGSDLNTDTRIEQVYGNIVSKRLSADWLNLGQPGSSNFFIAERIEEFSKVVKELSYSKIHLICTFTEIGRGINSHHDMHIDYCNWFQETAIEKESDFNQLLNYLNKDCTNRIKKVAKQHNLELLVGSNFVDAIGIDNTKLLPNPWYKLLGIACPVTSYAGSTGVARLKDLLEFVPNSKKTLFKSWYAELIDLSSYTDQVCRTKPLVNTHPTAEGQVAWANYILEHIK